MFEIYKHRINIVYFLTSVSTMFLFQPIEKNNQWYTRLLAHQARRSVRLLLEAKDQLCQESTVQVPESANIVSFFSHFTMCIFEITYTHYVCTNS